MKKILIFLFVIVTMFTLTACKENYKKYHDWLYEEIPFEIMDSFTLPLLTEDGKYIIHWRSSNSDVFNNFGIFKEPINTVEFKLHYKLIDKEGNEVYSNSLSCQAIGRIDRETRI